MAYASTDVSMILSLSLVGGRSMWLDVSSDPSTGRATTGRYAGAGYGGRPRSSDASRVVGMRYGDLVVCLESSNGADPGKVTWGSVIASTADQASTAASTGFNTLYDVTISQYAST